MPITNVVKSPLPVVYLIKDNWLGKLATAGSVEMLIVLFAPVIAFKVPTTTFVVVKLPDIVMTALLVFSVVTGIASVPMLFETTSVPFVILIVPVPAAVVLMIGPVQIREPPEIFKAPAEPPVAAGKP